MSSSSSQQAVASLHTEVTRLRHELQTLKHESPAADETLYVGQYLVERLVQLGITVRSPSVLRSRLPS